MPIFEVLKLSFNNLRINKMRSFLTMLGIIIGIASVITITSVVHGAQSLIVNQIQDVGSNLIGILPGASDEPGPPAAVFGIVITTLTDDDIVAIKEQVPYVYAASSYVMSTDVVSWSNQKTTASITGVSPEYPRLSDAELAQGNFFTEDDKRAYANVAVIGSQVAQDLFSGYDPINQSIKVKKQSFRVIGIMEQQGTVGFQNVDNMIFVPVTTAQKKLLGINHIGFARLRIDQANNIEIAVEEVKEILRDRHNINNPTEDDFTVSAMSSALDTLNSVTSSLNLFLIAIASIALLVGGIGIMNIMLAAVNERIREIGLRKAVGAKKANIIIQFLIESITLTFFGALIGIIIGVFISFIISLIVNTLGYIWDFVITATSIIMSCGISIFVGLFFGLYPARKAAAYDPIVALRYE